jgi:lethal(2) giant larvae protein
VNQVLVLELSDMPAEQAISVASVDLLQDREGFTWKGHERLSPRMGPLPWPAGFQPRVLVQCLPPAAVTAVTLHAEWSLVAFGTSHGFGLFDYQRKSPVLARYVGQGRWAGSWSPGKVGSVFQFLILKFGVKAG